MKIEVTLQQDGSVNVTGPLGNKILCLGMLELAKGVVEKFDPNQTPGIMVARPNGLANGVR